MHLEDDVSACLTEAFQRFKKICTTFSDGTIDISSLKTILENYKAFLTLFDVIDRGKLGKMKPLLERRQSEIAKYDNEWKNNSNLLAVCRSLGNSKAFLWQINNNPCGYC